MRRIVDVKPEHPYDLVVTLSDGTQARVNVEPELHGNVFEPLRDTEYFMQGSFESEQGTIVWPNGADFSPEFLIETCTTSAQHRAAV
ncbi:MAG: DUF2442 domain-containing protein [Dehalococcoidia bacterium]